MRSLLALAAALAAAAGSSAALLGDPPATRSADRGLRAVAPAQPRPAAPTTRILTVAIDSQGLRVLRALDKPELPYAPPPLEPERRPFQWTLRDATGAAVARGGFDPSRLCLDPAHHGQPPHLEGDFVVPHLAHCNLKIPARDDAAILEVARTNAAQPLARLSTGDWQELR